MAHPKECEGCSHAQTCKEAYQHLGGRTGPSVALPVLIAFLLPIIAFVTGLGVFGRLLQGAVAGPYQTPLALVLALLTTTGLMLVVRTLMRPHR